MKYRKYRIRSAGTNSMGHPAGTICYDTKGWDYGCANDDTRFTGVEHKSVTLNEDGDYPFFTVHTHDLEEIKE